MVRLRLTRKLAAMLDGIDVSSVCEGDILELPERAAAMLIAEQWAEPVVTESRGQPRTSSSHSIS
jgi:hypothetical protein